MQIHSQLFAALHMLVQLMQGMPYMMGPGGTPMQAMPPGLAMPGAMHPMHSMPGMFPASPMAFPGMPMAAAPYGFVAQGQEGMPMQMPSPAMYGGFPPHQPMPFQLPAMSLEQQMQQPQMGNQMGNQMSTQLGNHTRGWSNNNFSRRNSSNQQTPRSQHTSR